MRRRRAASVARAARPPVPPSRRERGRGNAARGVRAGSGTAAGMGTARQAAARAGNYASRMSHGSAAGRRAANAPSATQGRTESQPAPGQGESQPAPGQGARTPAPPTGPGPAVDAARLRVAVARLSRRLRRHELAGLTPTQLSTLATVERTGPARLSDLAAAEGIAPSTLTRLVTALEEHAYVERCPVPSDARASTLSITDSGRAVLDHIREKSTVLLADILRTLTREQVAAIAEALPALERLADADPRGR